jgi:hypothetical protein
MTTTSGTEPGPGDGLPDPRLLKDEGLPFRVYLAG